MLPNKSLVHQGAILWCFVTIFTINVQSAQAQEVSLQDYEASIPTDPKVRIGKLDNGLTYYIRQNSRPENKVDLRLVVNAGSLQEDDDQLGLAHFTEHMAFNGSKNFEKNELVSYLQTVGVKFGAHLNAYTSFDETVYILPIPSDDEEIIEKGFQILEDWAHNLSFLDEEIDKERGVVIEEWRLGQGADRRMLDQYLPVIFKDSRYAERLPIGTKDILENFDYETIKRFYKDWYRPDLMAVVVVGDIDPDKMEQKVKDHFGGITPSENPRARESYLVPDHDDTKVMVVSDKEASFTQIRIYNKTDPKGFSNLGDYRRYIMQSMYTGMLNARLDEKRQEADPPYIGAISFFGGTWARSKAAFQSFATVNEAQIEKGLTALLVENERVRRHGFTPSELDRYKKDMLRRYEQSFNERDKTESANYTGEYANNFLEGEPIPGIEFEFEFVKANLDGIQVEELNQFSNSWQTERNRVVVITGPDKEGVVLPTEDRVRELLEGVKTLDIAPYEDAVISDQLVAALPTAGEIASTATIPNIDVEKLTLSNGATVYLKKTDFKNDEVMLAAHSPGGHSLSSDEQFQSAANASNLINIGGVGEFSAVDLEKALAGKTVQVNPYIGELSEGMQGGASPQDLETMFQLIYLYFTSPRKDEQAFQSFMARQRAVLANIFANPSYYYRDQMIQTMTSDHPRGRWIPTEEDLNSIDLDVAFDFYKDRFADASDFTFWFVGNFNRDQIGGLIEQYIASLPSTNRKEEWKDVGIRPPTGALKKDVRKGTDPKSQVVLSFTNPIEYDRKESYYLSYFGDVLNIKLIENLREEMSGVYGVGASVDATDRPYEHYELQIQFPCAPENVDKLIEAAVAEVKKIQENGVSDEDMQKIKETRRRSTEESLRQNGFWMGILRTYHVNGWDPSDILDYQKRLDALTSDNIQSVAKKYVNTDEYISIVLYPEEG